MSNASAVAAGHQATLKDRTTRLARHVAREHSIWIVAFLLVVFFSFSSPFFLTPFNISNVLTQSVLIGFLALGLTSLMISGNIDLSVGSTTALTACVCVLLQPYGPFIALGGALGAGLAVGLVNGVIVEKIGISSFITTLAMMSGVSGLAFLITGDVSLSAPDFSYNDVAMMTIGPFNSLVIVFFVLTLAFALILNRTQHGRNLFAIGGNREAALDAGIPVSRHVIISFLTCGLMSAICGIAMSSNLASAAPSFAPGYELLAIAAVVLGGTRLDGGKGRISGTVGAVLSLAILRNGLNLMGASPFLINVVVGSILIIALLLDRQLNRN